MNCRIFDIKRYSINDGPGIRTTLFMKGCPLRCVWCHNPESWDSGPQKLFKAGKCIGCLSCVDVCPQGLDPRHALELAFSGRALENVGCADPTLKGPPSYDAEVVRGVKQAYGCLRPEQQGFIPPEGTVFQGPAGNGNPGSQCILCGKCVEECPTCALEMCGKEYSMDELMQEVEKERMVMEDSGGGVTLCGGEPLMHRTYLMELLHELGRRGFHRAIDTTLFASQGTVKEATENSELLLIDLKHMDPEKHRFYTGQSNELILSNIRMVAGMGADFFIRIPLIDGVNSDEDNIEATAAFLESLAEWKRRTVNLLPYHDIGKGKHDRMRTTYNPEQLAMSTPSEETQQRCIAQFGAHGIKAIIGG